MENRIEMDQRKGLQQVLVLSSQMDLLEKCLRPRDAGSAQAVNIFLYRILHHSLVFCYAVVFIGHRGSWQLGQRSLPKGPGGSIMHEKC